MPASFLLAGGATQVVIFTVAVPRDATGAYYATIEAFGKLAAAPGDAVSGASIRFSYQANTIVMGVVKRQGLRPELTLRGIDLKRVSAVKGGARPWSLTALVENTGTIHTLAEGSAEITSTSGVRVWQGSLSAGKGTLIPGYPRLFSSSEIRSLPDGRYIVGVEIRAPAQRLTMRGAQGFEVANGAATAANAEGPLWARSGGLVATPSAVMFAGPARASRSAVVSLTNNLKKKVSCKLSVSPWRVRDDGMAGPCAAPDAPRNAASWVTIKPESVDLAPGATQRIQVTASIPNGVRGEHYAGILVAPSAEDAQGVLPPSVMVTVLPDKTQDPGLVVKSAEVESAPSGGYQLTVRARNTGNVRLVPDLTCEVLDAKGIRVGEAIPIRGDGNAVFPGVISTWSAVSTRVLPPGKYTLRVIAKAEKDTPGTGLTAPFAIPLLQAKAPAAAAPSVRPKPPVARRKPASVKPSKGR